MTDIYFLVLPNLLLLDLAGPVEAFLEANAGGERFRLHFVGPEPTIRLPGPIALGELAPLPDSLPPGATVVITGMHRTEETLKLPACLKAERWLRRVITPEHTLVTVCGGALLAARAGLLAGRSCTTHHTLVHRLQALEPTARVRDDRIFVQDGNVYTSAGVTAGVDLALFLIAERVGETVALAVARELVVYLRRGPDDPQLSPWLSHRNHLEPTVHAVQDLICRHPEQHMPLSVLARRVHVSVRHLTRVFRAVTGVSIHDYQVRIRVDHARRLLTDTAHPMERVAELAGFGTARSLRRRFQATYGYSPAALRKRA